MFLLYFKKSLKAKYKIVITNDVAIVCLFPFDLV